MPRLANRTGRTGLEGASRSCSCWSLGEVVFGKYYVIPCLFLQFRLAMTNCYVVPNSPEQVLCGPLQVFKILTSGLLFMLRNLNTPRQVYCDMKAMI